MSFWLKSEILIFTLFYLQFFFSAILKFSVTTNAGSLVHVHLHYLPLLSSPSELLKGHEKLKHAFLDVNRFVCVPLFFKTMIVIFIYISRVKWLIKGFWGPFSSSWFDINVVMWHAYVRFTQVLTISLDSLDIIHKPVRGFAH